MRYPTRKSIRIGTNYLPQVLHCELSQEQQGQLLQWILEYLFQGKEPQNPGAGMGTLWNYVRWDLDYEKRRKAEKAKHGK